MWGTTQLKLLNKRVYIRAQNMHSIISWAENKQRTLCEQYNTLNNCSSFTRDDKGTLFTSSMAQAKSQKMSRGFPLRPFAAPCLLAAVLAACTAASSAPAASSSSCCCLRGRTA